MLLPPVLALAIIIFSAPALGIVYQPEDEPVTDQPVLPFFDLGNESEVVVFVVDNTESMALKHGEKTRAEIAAREITDVIGKLSDNVSVGVVSFGTAPRCKHSGVKQANMGTELYLARFLWWAYKGKLEDGVLSLDDVAYVWGGPYTEILPPAKLDSADAAGRVENFLEKRGKPRGMSSMAAGLQAALKTKNVSTVLLVADGPPAVMLDGREWKLPGDSKDKVPEDPLGEAEKWSASPWFPQGEIPEKGIDGYVLDLAEKAGIKDVLFFAAYFDCPDWGKKLLEDLAKDTGGEAFKIKATE